MVVLPGIIIIPHPILIMIYLIPVLIIIAILVYVYETYNELIKHKISVEKQASDILVHLKRKYDLIPALVNTVKGYATHEKGTLEEVTNLRSQWRNVEVIDEKLKTSNMLEAALSKLLLVQEQYPDLKADDNFMDLQEQLTFVEGSLAKSRIEYNHSVKDYNTIIKLFPKIIIAKLFKFKEKPFFSIDN